MSSKKSLIINGAIFILLIAMTFYIVFYKNDMGDMKAALTNVNMWYILAALCCAFAFIVGEGINIGRALKVLGEDTTYKDSFKYALIGFFFSSVTPSASGGQPMQLYYMKKDNLSLSHSGLALLAEVGSYQIVNIPLALIAFIYSFDFIMSQGIGIKILIAIGAGLNILALVAILLALFSPPVSMKLVGWIVKFLKKIKIKRADKLEQKAEQFIEKYQTGAQFIKQNTKVIWKILLTTTVQMIAFHSVPFMVYKAFGLDTYSYLTIVALQAVLYIASSSIPLPGAVGVSEGGFMVLFRTLFPAGMLGSAMILSRGISFYFFVLVSGIAVIITQLMIIRREHKGRIAVRAKTQTSGTPCRQD